MRRLAILTAAVALLPPAMVGLGRAAHADSCSQEWSATNAGSRVCSANLYGMPILLTATAACGSGCNERVEVHATVTLSTSAVVVAECSASGRGFVSCDDEVSTLGIPIDDVIGGIPIECRVSGSPGGTFFCDTGCWDPSLAPHCELLRQPLPTP